jgi:predicted ferric reductase
MGPSLRWGDGSMKSLGSLAIAILAGIVVLWLLVKLVFFTFKLIGLAIAVAVVAAVFFAVRALIEGPRDA